MALSPDFDTVMFCLVDSRPKQFVDAALVTGKSLGLLQSAYQLPAGSTPPIPQQPACGNVLRADGAVLLRHPHGGLCLGHVELPGKSGRHFTPEGRCIC